MPNVKFNKHDKSPGDDFQKHTTKFCRSQQGARTRQMFCTLAVENFRITKVLIKNSREISHVYKHSKIGMLIFTAFHGGTNKKTEIRLFKVLFVLGSLQYCLGSIQYPGSYTECVVLVKTWQRYLKMF